ncbi:MAG TPA: hypothetical protein VM912_07130 [Terriglobales bacterium]|nr:hypothetical protein [Terriglobales bacterium]
MQWLGPETAKYERPRWPVLLSVCPDIDRMQFRERMLHAAGYSVASASTLFAAHEMCELCNFDLVVLDCECASEGAVTYIQQRYPSVLLEPGTSERQLLSKVNEVLRHASVPAAVH